MWFGTNDGLNRFDGVNFKTYRKQQNDPYSLGNNFIHCLIEDSYGRFLIGTKSGLYLYNRDLENFSHIIIDKKKEIGKAIKDGIKGDEIVGSESVRTYIKRLRDILGEKSIETFKGIGYRLK